MFEIYYIGNMVNAIAFRDYDGNKIYSIRWTDPVTGKLHREDGPAYERSDGYKQYRINGFLHRLNRPAIIDPSLGEEEFWEFGNILKTRLIKK